MHQWARKGLVSYPETDAEREREREGSGPPGLGGGDASAAAAHAGPRDWAGRVFRLEDVFVDWRGRVFNATHRFYAGGCSSGGSGSSWLGGDEDGDDNVSVPRVSRSLLVVTGQRMTVYGGLCTDGASIMGALLADFISPWGSMNLQLLQRYHQCAEGCRS